MMPRQVKRQAQQRRPTLGLESDLGLGVEIGGESCSEHAQIFIQTRPRLSLGGRIARHNNKTSGRSSSNALGDVVDTAEQAHDEWTRPRQWK